MTFDFKHLDFELPTNKCVSMACIGTSRSGKTTLLKYIYGKHFRRHMTIMFSMNPQADIYKNLSKRILISSSFHGTLLREAHELNKISGNRYPFLFISDDYVGGRIKDDPEITRALTIYRNANISTIFSFQGRTLMNATGRNNLNYVFILKQQTPRDWEAVIKEYLSMYFPIETSMREMIDFCKEHTKDHEFFFINNITGECYMSKLTPSQVT